MKDYQCKICNYVYRTIEGDPIHSVAPSTEFEAIPDSWRCPVCGVKKTEFKPIESQNNAID